MAIDIHIHPNPTRGILHVDGLDGQPAHIRVLDSRGSLAFSAELAASGQADVSGLPQGLYFVELRSGDKAWVKRLVKM